MVIKVLIGMESSVCLRIVVLFPCLLVLNGGLSKWKGIGAPYSRFTCQEQQEEMERLTKQAAEAGVVSEGSLTYGRVRWVPCNMARASTEVSATAGPPLFNWQQMEASMF